MSSASHLLNPTDVCRQLMRTLPIALFVVVFGVAFGLASVQAGLTEWQSILMSVTVFAGASQFATLELWGESVSLLPLVAVVFAINARHILMGAALYPMLRELPAGRRYAILFVLTDANWAMATQDYQNGRENLSVILGGGLVLWLAWVAGTVFGVTFGGLVADPERYGLDMVLGCFLLSMVLGGKRSPRVLLIWTVAGLSAVAAYWWLPPHTHVIVGAMAGGVLGYCWKERRHDD